MKVTVGDKIVIDVLADGKVIIKCEELKIDGKLNVTGKSQFDAELAVTTGGKTTTVKGGEVAGS